MYPDHPTSGSTTGPDPSSRLRIICSQLFSEGLISPHLGGSLSIKISVKDAFGRNAEVLLMQGAESKSLLIARLPDLIDLAHIAEISELERQHALFTCRISSESALPDEMALLHACLPVRSALMITHPDLLVLSCIETWKQDVAELLGSDVAGFDYVELDTALYRLAAEVAADPAMHGIYLRYYGLLVWANEPEDAALIAGRFAHRVSGLTTSRLELLERAPTIPHKRIDIAERRLEASRTFGAAHLLRLSGKLPSGYDTASLNTPGAPTAPHLLAFKVPPGSQRRLEPDGGLSVFARNATELDIQVDYLKSELTIRAAAMSRGTLELLPYQSRPTALPADGVFSGEVALVTGAASGIGKAAVESLLARQAAVVGLDIKPDITSLFTTPSFLGLEVDLTDEAAVLDCLEQAVRAYGGLDMLVLNAGIFPPSRNLEALTLDHWRQVMQINLDVNVTLLREAYPLLKLAPRYGRVVINSSRNVPAPGPGAAAYSASKAALTQLGRVAALEWASSGIRVNILNPHAVFDTGIWTDEVITSRAAKYGLTVEQYKTNNLLHVELMSHDVGEMIAEALSPLFSKTTGAQIPIDGGSERVV